MGENLHTPRNPTRTGVRNLRKTSRILEPWSVVSAGIRDSKGGAAHLGDLSLFADHIRSDPEEGARNVGHIRSVRDLTKTELIARWKRGETVRT